MSASFTPQWEGGARGLAVLPDNSHPPSDRISVGHGAGAQTPLGQDSAVREALECPIDRDAINQVVLDGQYVPANQAELPRSKYWNPDIPAPKRDPVAAKALLRKARFDRVPFTLTVTNTPRGTQLGEMIQSMVAEAGFDVKVQRLEVGACVSSME